MSVSYSLITYFPNYQCKFESFSMSGLKDNFKLVFFGCFFRNWRWVDPNIFRYIQNSDIFRIQIYSGTSQYHLQRLQTNIRRMYVQGGQGKTFENPAIYTAIQMTNDTGHFFNVFHSLTLLLPFWPCHTFL